MIVLTCPGYLNESMTVPNAGFEMHQNMGHTVVDKERDFLAYKNI